MGVAQGAAILDPMKQTVPLAIPSIGFTSGKSQGSSNVHLRTGPQGLAWGLDDVLACPSCGDRLRLLATIISSEAIHRILAHLQLPTRLPVLSPARAPPGEAA
jgi:hypothetical protein